MRPRKVIADSPGEVRFFLALSAFGIAIGIVYWFVAYETAGTVLLVGFGVATGLIGLRLLARAGGASDVDRPFLDERGRLPDETLAPFAVGLGVAVAATGVVFGPAPVVLGLLPLAWGARSWLSAARAELDAQVSDDAASVGVGDPGGPGVRRGRGGRREKVARRPGAANRIEP